MTEVQDRSTGPTFIEHPEQVFLEPVDLCLSADYPVIVDDQAVLTWILTSEHTIALLEVIVAAQIPLLVKDGRPETGLFVDSAHARDGDVHRSLVIYLLIARCYLLHRLVDVATKCSGTDGYKACVEDNAVPESSEVSGQEHVLSRKVAFIRLLKN